MDANEFSLMSYVANQIGIKLIPMGFEDEKLKGICFTDKGFNYMAVNLNISIEELYLLLRKHKPVN